MLRLTVTTSIAIRRSHDAASIMMMILLGRPGYSASGVVYSFKLAYVASQCIPTLIPPPRPIVVTPRRRILQVTLRRRIIPILQRTRVAGIPAQQYEYQYG
jgi:hypothetical protein